MLMRSEAEIRRQVAARFRRWAFLLLDGGLWLVTMYGRVQLEHTYGLAILRGDSGNNILLGWSVLFIAHLLYMLYVETRDLLVRRAVTHEYHHEKRKHKRDETVAPRSAMLADDGELIDFPDMAARSREGEQP